MLQTYNFMSFPKIFHGNNFCKKKFLPIKFVDLSTFFKHTYIIKKSPYVTCVEHLLMLRVQIPLHKK